MRGVWEELYPAQGSIKVQSKAEPGVLMDVVAEFVEETEDGKAPDVAKIRESLKPFVVAQ